jgi:hypothetical protein
MEPKSQEDIDAEKAAEAYRKENHPDIEEGKSVYSGVVEDQQKAAEEEKKAQENAPMSSGEKYAIGAGAGAGAYATHKDLVRKGAGKFLAPAESTYSVPKSSVTVQAVSPPEPLLPSEVTGVDNFDDQVEKMIHALKDEETSSGRQRMGSFNDESQRQSLATKEALETKPGAGKVLVEMGPTARLESDIVLKKGTARDVLQERADKELREKAIRKVSEQNAQAADKRELEEKIAAQKQAQAEAKVAQEAEEARLLRNAKIRYGLGRVGIGALGGALGAKDIYDVYQKPYKDWNEEDYLKMAGGVGGVLSTIPTPITEGAGLALAGGALAYPYVKRAFTK